MLTDTRRTKQRWRSVGSAHVGEAGGKKNHHILTTVPLEQITNAVGHDAALHYLHYATNTGPLFYLTTIDRHFLSTHL
jgi:hypothetical protein